VQLLDAIIPETIIPPQALASPHTLGDYLRLMSTPNHRRHFGALGATASGIKVSSGGREGILFDHLVGDGEQRRRHLDAERPGRCGSEQPASGKVSRCRQERLR
jgi:hypothetical protein